MKIMDVQDFSWSPSDPIIAVFIPGLHGKDDPARVRKKSCFLEISVSQTSFSH